MIIKKSSKQRDLINKSTTIVLILKVSTIKNNQKKKGMVEMNNNGNGAHLAGKKRMLPSEICHKFSCKDEFLYFFSKQVSYLISS